MKKRTFHSFMGISAVSLAIVLIILTITCFAVLTFISADSEYRLSEQGARSVKEYYHADAVASEVLATIFAAENRKNIQDILTKKGYNVTIRQKRNEITIRVPVNDLQVLQVTAAYPFSSQVEILEWGLVSAGKGDSEKQ